MSRVAPVLGFGKIVANTLSANEGRADLALNAARALGDVVRLPVPGKKVFLVTHPRDLRRVMVQNAANYRKSFDYKILARLLGDGLLTSEGEIWQKDRRLQQPLFHGRALEQFTSSIGACVDAMVARWKPGDEIVMEEETTRFGIHVIGERILSLDVREFSDEISHHLDVCQRQIVARGLALVDFARWFRTPAERRFERSLSALYAIIDLLIEKRASLNISPQRSAFGGPCGSSREERYDLYSILVADAGGRQRLRDHFLTLFMAGHETTAIALTWMFYGLARMPEVDARVATGDENYIERVINESLRLYPPVSFMGREAIADDELGGYAIPKGAIIVLCPYATHRRAELWPDPDRFDPERFTPEAVAALAPCSFIPFAAGPRGCIGMHFAMIEMQLAISRATRAFRFRLVDEAEIRPIPLISMRPSRPVRMRVEKR